MRTLASVALCFGLTIGLGGCRHKPQVATLPPVLTPVALEEIPEPENLPMVEDQPPSCHRCRLRPMQGSRSGRGRGRCPRRRLRLSRCRWRVAAAPPSPEETAIGALTAGGEASPQTKQEAADLITSSEKRLNALPAQKAEDEKAQVSKVKNFLKDAQEALKSGDAEGAKTLATKAKLLLDDMEKP